VGGEGEEFGLGEFVRWQNGVCVGWDSNLKLRCLGTGRPGLFRGGPEATAIRYEFSECEEVGWVEKEGFVGLLGDFARWY